MHLVRTRRCEEGSVAITMLVIMVTTILIVGYLLVAQSGLRQSRRAGDSANALQVADAGVNDAVKKITDNTSSFSGSANLGAAGSYTYTATPDGFTWHIDAVGTDRTGVQRHIKADAVDRPLFSNAFFAFQNANLKGTTDSYSGPSTPQTRCLPDSLSDPTQNKGLGVLGSNGTITFQSSGGGNLINCNGSTWGYATDGCVYYLQQTVPATASIGPNQCPPPPNTVATPQSAPSASVTPPAGYVDEGNFTCAQNGTIPSGTHVYKTITLNNGCHVAVIGGVAQKTVLYAIASGSQVVQLGTSQGDCKDVINEPQPPGGGCPDNSWYTSGWPANLEINVPAGGSVSVANHGQFWGVVNAPGSVLTTNGGASPQVDVFGSIIASTASSGAQFNFHYDSSLGQVLRTGQFVIHNWREEPLGT
jgi:hypothetical protein